MSVVAQITAKLALPRDQPRQRCELRRAREDRERHQLTVPEAEAGLAGHKRAEDDAEGAAAPTIIGNGCRPPRPAARFAEGVAGAVAFQGVLL